MSFAAPSFQAFRTCTAALSSRTLARPTATYCSARLSRLGTRCYSEGKTSQTPEVAKEGSAGESTGTQAESTELEAKLKAKEAEVTDLTVRPLTPLPFQSLTSTLARADCGTCRRIS
jgi:molecular chaperone GrpE